MDDMIYREDCTCDICGMPATYTITDIDPNPNFCDVHYIDFINKEFELPQERLDKVLQ